MADGANPDDVEQQLWREIDKGTTVMLGLVGEPSHQHFQPMTAFCEKEQGGPVWFYLRKNNDLVRVAGQGGAAMFNLMRGHEFFACVAGRVREDHDPERIRRFWNPVVAAWFPEGQDDPNLTLLRFDCEDAQVWVSHGNPLKFGWEIAKANATKTKPDVGDQAHLSL